MENSGHGLNAGTNGMDTQDLEFKLFAKTIESNYLVTATYV